MNSGVFAAGSIGVVLSLGILSAATADEKGDLEALLAENRNLAVQLAKARTVQADIVKAETELNGAQQALYTAKNDVKRAEMGLLENVRRREQQARQAGCPWGGTSTDKAFVAACNAEGARLNNWLFELQKEGADLRTYERKLGVEQQRLSKSTLTLFAKKKSNNRDLELLGAAQADWQRRYNEFLFRSSTYERLKKTAPGTQECERISADASDEALRRAADCLQRMWDGLR